MTSSLSLCTGCSLPIQDQFFLKVHPNMEWHANCLKCCYCNVQLGPDNTCFVKDSRIYCQTHYNGLFQSTCPGCGEMLQENDLVYRTGGQAFHSTCFYCSICQQILQPGDQCGLADNRLYCAQHIGTIEALKQNNDELCIQEEMLYHRSRLEDEAQSCELQKPDSCVDEMVNCIREEIQPTLVHHSTTQSLFHSSYCDSNSKPSDAGGRSNGTLEGEVPTTDEMQTMSEELAVGSPSPSSSSTPAASKAVLKTRGNKQQLHKTTRVRTVLNDKQLHTLRTCYTANPRPDALMKEQLVEMTGLSPRVIRVWFQNKRCKDKKRQILMKQMEQQHQRPLSGIQLIAGSPIRNESSLVCGANSVDVQQYPANWIMDHIQTGINDPYMEQTSSFHQMMLGFREGIFQNYFNPIAGVSGCSTGVTDSQSGLLLFREKDPLLYPQSMGIGLPLESCYAISEPAYFPMKCPPRPTMSSSPCYMNLDVTS